MLHSARPERAHVTLELRQRLGVRARHAVEGQGEEEECDTRLGMGRAVKKHAPFSLFEQGVVWLDQGWRCAIASQPFKVV